MPELAIPDWGEERYLDVLQNIEFAFVEVYRSDSELLDSEVESALAGLVTALNARRLGKSFEPARLKLSARGRRVFDGVGEICEWRMTGGAHPPGGIAPERRSPEELVACLNRVRKSVRRWTKERGRRGYLEFVREYLP